MSGGVQCVWGTLIDVRSRDGKKPLPLDDWRYDYVDQPGVVTVITMIGRPEPNQAIIFVPLWPEGYPRQTRHLESTVGLGVLDGDTYTMTTRNTVYTFRVDLWRFSPAERYELARAIAEALWPEEAEFNRGMTN